MRLKPDGNPMSPAGQMLFEMMLSQTKAEAMRYQDESIYIKGGTP